LEANLKEGGESPSHLKRRNIHMLIAMLEGAMFFAILLTPIAIMLGISYLIIKREDKTK
jgi:hypothetical protein